MSSTEFSPNWRSAPGDTISDVLAERGVSVAEFARRMDQSREAVRSLLEGDIAITLATARKLESVLGASVQFWMSRDYQYREGRAADDAEWLAELPLAEMVKFGWIDRFSPANRAAACLAFFGVESVQALNQAYSTMLQGTAFRTSPAFEAKPGAVAAWLRKGELESQQIRCADWDPAKFQESLTEIRRLTREKDPETFIPELRRLCAKSGVAAVVLRAPTGCRASGATRFLDSGRALLLLSFRYLSDDHFWFSFFHEAGHLLLHGDKGPFIEAPGAPKSAEELEANEFAASVLLPAEYRQAFNRLRPTVRNVIRFASTIGVSPGIVVGQLQHHDRIGKNHLNSLKRRYRWED